MYPDGKPKEKELNKKHKAKQTMSTKHYTGN
jgi:hypothetical protein